MWLPATLLELCIACHTEFNGHSPFPPHDEPPGLGAEGLSKYIAELKVTTVEDLLRRLPDYFRESYVYVHRSASLHQASVQQPRAILFGTDARFLMAVGSSMGDPRREIVEIQELDPKTGRWQFGSLEFLDQGEPVWRRSESTCLRCHGDPPRPIWGNYAAWPGAFGNESAQVTQEQASVLQRIRTNLEERFHSLPYRSIPAYSLVNRRYGYPNTSFNFELGSAVAEGLYLRSRARVDFASLRSEVLWKAWCARDVVSAVRRVGLFARNDLLLHQSVTEAADPSDYYWNQGSTYLHELFLFLVLDDLLQDDPQLASIFRSTEERRQRWMTSWWRIRGEERREFLKERFDFYQDDIRPQELVAQVGNEMCSYLQNRVSTAGRR